MRAYINGTSAISPQLTFEEAAYLQAVQPPQGDYLQAQEPDYRQYIDPKLSRRMARIIKMSVAAAMKSLQQAGIEQPAAITVGTGLGCLQDTEKFLAELVETGEGLLSPTAFIQSTHNTIAGQIALLLGCTNHNFTFVQRAFSFERALEDSLLQIHEGLPHVLLGGVDEATLSLYKILHQAGCAGQAAGAAPDSADEKPAWGEGASFFVLSAERTSNSIAQLEGLKTFYLPENPAAELVKQVRSLLASNEITAAEVDALMLGYNGHVADGALYDLLRRELFPQQPVLGFKHLCGEYFTASAFGLHLASRSMQYGKVPAQVQLGGTPPAKPLNKLLFYNHFQGKYHTLMLLSACRLS